MLTDPPLDEDDETSEPPLKKRCTNDDSSHDIKPAVQPSDNIGSDKAGAIERRLLSATTTPVFTPLSLQSQWVEPGSTTRMVTVAMVLPTGVGKGQFDVKVLDGGREVELKVMLPEPLSNLRMLHRKWVETAKDGSKMQMYHPKVLGFEASLKQFRKHSNEKIEATARIALPFPVQNHIAKRDNLGWLDNDCKVVYIDLKAHDDEYLVTRDENSFEIC